MQTFFKDGFQICESFVFTQECEGLIAQAYGLFVSFNETRIRLCFQALASLTPRRIIPWTQPARLAVFFEAGAVDEAGHIKPKTQAVNKIGHASHNLDAVFDIFHIRINVLI